jgi:hypothetical protein
MFSAKYGKVSFSREMFLGLNLLIFWKKIATFFHNTKLKKSLDPKIPPKRKIAFGGPILPILPFSSFS